MAHKIQPQIVIIDDDIKRGQYPLIDALDIEYQTENVHIFATPEDGIAYINANLDKKIIVLLDIMFNGNLRGFEVFDKIRIEKENALICFIIMTGSAEKITTTQYMNLVNNHAWYIVKRDEPAKKIMQVIKAAETNMMGRVDTALEEWINVHEYMTREEPYLRMADGSTMSMNDVLKEIRQGTHFGKEMEQNILKVAVATLRKEAEDKYIKIKNQPEK